MILNEQQKMVQDMMRSYAQEKLKPTAAERDKTAQFPAQELKELGALGALGMTVSEQWGGAGLDYISLVLALEEIAAGDGAISTIVSVQNSLPCGIIQRYGTEAQKQHYTHPLKDLNVREIALLLICAFGLLWLGLYPQSFLDVSNSSMAWLANSYIPVQEVVEVADQVTTQLENVEIQ